MTVVVAMPSRGRPAAAAATIEAIRDTAVLADTFTVVGVDSDDPELGAYRALGTGWYGRHVTLVVLEPAETGNLAKASNALARRILSAEPDAIIGNLGDDHRPRTPGWDCAIADALERPGIAYGDDLIHGERLPSAPFISGELVRRLGWYFMPALEHMYVDDATRELGLAAGRLRYLADVVIEHMHPAVGKAEWDASYRKSNAPEAMSRDRAAYEAWLGSEAFASAVAAIS